MTSRPRRDEILLSIGGCVGRLELLGGAQTFIQQLHARYGAFELPAATWVESDFSLRLDLTPPPPPKPGDALAALKSAPLTVKATQGGIRVSRWDLAVKMTASATGRGRQIRYRGKGSCTMNPFAVDCILRVLYATILPRLGGMLIHSCGLRHAEIGVVFPGQSGAGKTTLARKAPDAADVLSDELVVVRRADDGWRVHGTPFWGDFARGGTSMRSWPLRTLAFLEQAPRDTVTMTPILSADATLRLLGCFLAFSVDRETVERNVALAIELGAQVRSVEASLTKNVPTQQIFRKLAPHLGPEVTRKVPPLSSREMVSEFRSLLLKHRSYRFRPKGPGVHRWLKQGDSLLVEAAPVRDLSPGDTLLYWMPGETPDDDALVCQRLPASPESRRGDGKDHVASFENGRDAEVLGKVAVVSRDGTTLPLPGRAGNLAHLFGSLVATPILTMVGR
jgi:hypothetical protein